MVAIGIVCLFIGFLVIRIGGHPSKNIYNTADYIGALVFFSGMVFTVSGLAAFAWTNLP
jgi:hypothetical protein